VTFTGRCAGADRTGLAGSCCVARAGPACGGAGVSAVPSELAGAPVELAVAAGVRSSRPRETLGRDLTPGEGGPVSAPESEVAVVDAGAADSLRRGLRESGWCAAACGVVARAAPSRPSAVGCSVAGGEDGARRGDVAGAGLVPRESPVVRGACTGSSGASVAPVRERPAGGLVAGAVLGGPGAAAGAS
jgi:hypothetical protein